MSIVACVKVYDGIVLGAESMTQLFAEVQPGAAPQPVKAFSNARKLFQLSNLAVGVLAYGGGNIGKRSIESYLTEFSQGLDEPTGLQLSVETLAGRLLGFVREAYNRQYGTLPEGSKPQIGFYVAGYSPGQHLGSEWEFVLPVDEAARRTRPEDQFGASWRGISVPFTRLHFGVDPRLLDLLQSSGIPSEILGQIQSVAARLVSPVVFDGMPVQDALGFCKFILETTIGMATYELGTPSCGGPLQVAVITRSEGFRWIAKPDFTLSGKEAVQ